MMKIYLIHSTVVYLVENNIRNMKLINSEKLLAELFMRHKKRALQGLSLLIVISVPPYVLSFFFDCFKGFSLCHLF